MERVHCAVRDGLAVEITVTPGILGEKMESVCWQCIEGDSVQTNRQGDGSSISGNHGGVYCVGSCSYFSNMDGWSGYRQNTAGVHDRSVLFLCTAAAHAMDRGHADFSVLAEHHHNALLRCACQSSEHSVYLLNWCTENINETFV